MKKINDIVRSIPMQERKHRRFSLQYPVRLKVHDADYMVELEAMSRNISLGGLLLETSLLIPRNAAVSFRMIVRTPQAARPLHFVGEGKVVRVDARVTEKPAERMFAIAVQCKRPISRTDDPLAATGS